MFIGYPEATLRQSADPSSKVLKKVLWGDWCTVLESGTAHSKIRCRNATGWVSNDKIQPNQLLEVNFIDVGQGDGCFIVTPDDKYILIDAGVGDNMFRFLKWRFNLDRNNFQVPIEHLIISHPDEDHYYGFQHIINSPRFKIHKIHHNGIVERTGTDVLGPVSNGYLTDICSTHQQVSDLVSDKIKRGRKHYPNLLYDAMKANADLTITMLEEGMTIAGYENGDKVNLRILGPVSKMINGKKALKYFSGGDAGVAKNGHSVIVQLNIGKVRMLLGGDLNDASEEYLSQHYTGFNAKEVLDSDREEMIKKGREIFECDILKSCHHGSHKFIDDFLSFFNPTATVISSGDNETHTHPRPDTLGAIGKHSKGIRPLVFSTELARSAKEKMVIDDKHVAELYLLGQERKGASPARILEIDKRISELKYNMERVIAVYGMINVRTDGEKLIIAQKKEAKGAGFIIYKLEPDEKGKLVYKP